MKLQCSTSIWLQTESTCRLTDPLAHSIYFIHGLGGHAFNTWSSEIRREDLGTIKTWPQDFLPSRLREEGIQACIYTISYSANIASKAARDGTIENAAEDLLNRLCGQSGSVSAAFNVLRLADRLR